MDAKEAARDADAVTRVGALLSPVGPKVGVRPVARLGSVANAVPTSLAILARVLPGVGIP